MAPPFHLPGLLLCAGAALRLGGGKLQLPVGGRPLVAYPLRAARQGGLKPVVIVAGPWTPPALETFWPTQAGSSGGAVKVIQAAAAVQGQAESLKAGLREILRLAPEAPGVMILLGDMPLVGAKLVRALRKAFQTELAAGRPASLAPTFQGRRGHPVVLPARLFSRVLALRGDEGARRVLAQAPIHLLPWPDDSCLVDVDTPEDYDRLTARLSG